MRTALEERIVDYEKTLIFASALRCGGLRCVLSFSDLFDRLVAECGKIIRISARDEHLIHDHFLVQPSTACIANIRLERGV